MILKQIIQKVRGSTLQEHLFSSVTNIFEAIWTNMFFGENMLIGNFSFILLFSLLKDLGESQFEL